MVYLTLNLLVKSEEATLYHSCSLVLVFSLKVIGKFIQTPKELHNTRNNNNKGYKKDNRNNNNISQGKNLLTPYPRICQPITQSNNMTRYDMKIGNQALDLIKGQMRLPWLSLPVCHLRNHTARITLITLHNQNTLKGMWENLKSLHYCECFHGLGLCQLEEYPGLTQL